MSEYDYTTRVGRAEFYSSGDWRELRRLVLERDRYECVWCRSEGKVTTDKHSVLEVDHIMELEYYPEEATNIDNLRTLC